MTPITLVAKVPSTRWSTGRSSASPIMDLRDVPRRTGNPRFWKSSRWFIASRFISNVFPKPIPGSSMIFSSLMPACLARLTHSCVSASISMRKFWYSVLDLLCIRQQATSYFAITAAIFGSYFNPQISLTRSAPAWIELSATLLLKVSTETGMSKCFLTASITGRTLCASSSALTGVWPGRVDSPPISIISAPSAIIASVCLKASSIWFHLPPSEKESGVTFKIPIM